ncbi:MAG: AtpZ/AtpI family protein, partial [Myxococcota bacterium]
MSDDPQPNESDATRKPVKKAAWVRGAEASSVGIELAIAIVAPMIGGHYVEKHVTHWAPWTTLIGVFLGLFMAGLVLRRTMRDVQRSLRSD